jgi:peptidoglycan/LPS O-acetylase OafA/YrhL
MRTDYMDSCLIGVLLIINLLALPTSLLTRGIGWWPLRQLGRISYALYLLHLPIYNLLRHWYPAASVDQIAVATFALAVPAAALSWRLFESRLLLTQPAQQRRAGVRPTWTGGIAGTRAAGPSRKRSPAPGVAR